MIHTLLTIGLSFVTGVVATVLFLRRNSDVQAKANAVVDAAAKK